MPGTSLAKRPHARILVSTHKRAYAAANRQELREITPDWATIDHRRARALRSVKCANTWTPHGNSRRDVTVYIEAVHRLTDFGEPS